MIPFLRAAEKENRLFCIGGRDRYDFLEWICGSGNSVAAQELCDAQGKSKESPPRDVILQHGLQTHFFPLEDGQAVKVQAPKVPEGVEVVFPARQDMVPPVNLFDQALVFDSFPYLEQNVYQTAVLYQSRLPQHQVTVVVIQGGRRFAATDLQNEDETVEQVMLTYAQKGFAVLSLNRREFSRRLFHVSCNCQGALVQYRQKVVERGQSLLCEFYEDYEIFLKYDLDDILDQSFYQTCESYAACINANHLWQKIAENAEKLLFPPLEQMEEPSRNLIYAIYLSHMEPVCFWDIQDDLSCLRTKLIFGFHRASMGGMGMEKDGAAPRDQLAYMKMHNERQLHKKLSTVLQSYFENTCKTILAEQLKQQMKKIGVRVV